MEQVRIDDLMENHTQQQLVDLIDALESELVSKDASIRQQIEGMRIEVTRLTNIIKQQEWLQERTNKLLSAISEGLNDSVQILTGQGEQDENFF